ncbi:uncharacterized protein BP5553_05715 [Venustampulla echinocandica]|uniref:Putative gamma-glutamylcyclotransferase n=1 Tax=Venustampulla echinocandica TaxID=2656787 RepID=A0A370TLG3_9HELO|nr:uncharacterized protein BP5553_05715 [Venustampulla echinocandica]RDL36363.1 hypothetical protein BP5553_05715 [Venustampulla echinocandica]
MADRKAFFYGTLMVREVLYRVCYGDERADKDPILGLLAASLTIQPAILHDYCRHRVLNVDYPGIAPQKGHTVRGTYVTGLTDADIWRLDHFEGSEYERRDVQVQLLKKDGEVGAKEKLVYADAETYVYTAGEEHLEEREWDFDEFRREKMHRWVGSRQEYEEVDEALARNGHDQTGGRGVQNCSYGRESEGDVLKSAV